MPHPPFCFILILFAVPQAPRHLVPPPHLPNWYWHGINLYETLFSSENINGYTLISKIWFLSSMSKLCLILFPQRQDLIDPKWSMLPLPASTLHSRQQQPLILPILQSSAQAHVLIPIQTHRKQTQLYDLLLFFFKETLLFYRENF
jgi:hypothetical protein